MSAAVLGTLENLGLEAAVFDRSGELSWLSSAAAQRHQPLERGHPVPPCWPLLVEAVRATLADQSVREVHLPASRLTPLEGEVLVLFTSETATELEMFASASSRLAHDMRNPMAGLIAALSILSRRVPDEVQPITIQMKQSVEGLSRLVDQIVMFSRPVVPVPATARIDRLLEAALKDIRHAHPTLRLEAEDTDVSLQADPRLLRHCFRNLLANAAQAMATGGTVCVKTADTLGSVLVSFEDEGPGVSPDSLPRIFEPFFTTRSAGHGLGLTVAARIAEAHGGRVSSSPSERGACFIVELPRSR